MIYTEDPVNDAENYYSKEEKRPIIGTCESCGELIYGPTEDEYEDEYIELYDCFVHFDCWNDYGRSLMR